MPQVEGQKKQDEHQSQECTKDKVDDKVCDCSVCRLIEKLATDLLPPNVSPDVIEMSLGDKLRPLIAHLGLLPSNPKSIQPNNNNEIDADDDDNNHSVGTFSTLTLPIDRIERILKYHGGDKGDGGTSDIDDDGFDVVQDFEIPMNDNEDEKLLNDYDETETCVCDGANNASLSRSTSDYLPGAPSGWYPPRPPDDWKPWPHKVKGGEPVL